MSVEERFQRGYPLYQERLLATSSVTIADVLTSLNNLNRDKLYEFLQNRFDDPMVYNALRLIISCIDIVARTSELNPYNYYLKVNNILGSGVQGAVASADFKNDSPGPILAIKTLNRHNRVEIENLKREFMVAWFLRDFILETPIFNQTISINGCSGFVQEEENAIAYCENKDEQVSIINSIVEGHPISNYQFTESLFLPIFLLLLDGLNKVKHLEYVNYDLHTGNVMLRKLSKKMAFPITLGGKKRYLMTQYIPVIIDYGFSRIKTPAGVSMIKYLVENDNVLDKDDLEDYGVYDSYIPLYDVYTFLFYILLYQQNSDLYWLGHFFMETITKDILADISVKTNFILPRQFTNYRIEHYFNWIQQHPNYLNILLDNPPPGARVYGQYSELNVLREIGITSSDSRPISSSMDWYLYYHAGNRTLKYRRLLEIERKYPEFYTQYLAQIDNVIALAEYNQYLLASNSDDQKLIMAHLGDSIVALRNERIIMETLKRELKIEQPEADQLYKKLDEKLVPYQTFYRKNPELIFNIAYPGY